LAGKDSENKMTVVFDGDCGICTSSANYISKRDKAGKFLGAVSYSSKLVIPAHFVKLNIQAGISKPFAQKAFLTQEIPTGACAELDSVSE
jgi:hypothetical protein